MVTESEWMRGKYGDKWMNVLVERMVKDEWDEWTVWCRMSEWICGKCGDRCDGVTENVYKKQKSKVICSDDEEKKKNRQGTKEKIKGLEGKES